MALDLRKQEYFKAVFVGEDGWGPIDQKTAEDHGGMFHCGRCSIENQHKVFHNVLGVHNHIPSAELVKRIDAAVVI